MFGVRAQHLEAFAAAARENFVDRMAAHLFAAFPERIAKRRDEDVRLLIVDGIAHARQYGFVTERNVAQFLRLMVLVREDFDTARGTTWAREWLGRSELRPDERMNRILSEARRRGHFPPSGQVRVPEAAGAADA